MGKKVLFSWLLAALLAPALAAAQTVTVTGQVNVPPPPTVVVETATPPPPTVVYAEPAPPQQVVYAQPQPVYVMEAPEPETSPYWAVFSINPVLIWFGGVHFEFKLANWMALPFQVDFMYFGVSDGGFYLLGGLTGLNFFPGGRAPEGLYVGPRIGFDHLGLTREGSDYIELLRAGGAIGYQWIWDSQFAFAIGGGLVYLAAVASAEGADSFVADMVLPFVDVRFGFGI